MEESVFVNITVNKENPDEDLRTLLKEIRPKWKRENTVFDVRMRTSCSVWLVYGQFCSVHQKFCSFQKRTFSNQISVVPNKDFKVKSSVNMNVLVSYFCQQFSIKSKRKVATVSSYWQHSFQTLGGGLVNKTLRVVHNGDVADRLVIRINGIGNEKVSIFNCIHGNNIEDDSGLINLTFPVYGQNKE